jgi:allantoate deiminase
VGVVSAIAGATRAEARFAGRAGHAGTVPMAGRRDALTGAAEWALAVEATGRATPGLVATVGALQIEPGAPNVVPGAAAATLDVRHAEDAVREHAVAALRRSAEAIAEARELELTWTTRLETPAVAADERLSALLGDAVAAAGYPLVTLPSGAGHDAVALADLTGIAMLFVRCAGGVSHHPDESVERADVAAAIDVLCGLLERLAR